MPKSDSSAGDLAQEILGFLAKRYGADAARWTIVMDEFDVLYVEDENDVAMFVRVELA